MTFGGLVRFTHTAVVALLGVPTFACLRGVLARGSWEHRMGYLVVLLFLALPLWLLANRVWHRRTFYPLRFVGRHPVLAALFTTLGLTALALLLAAVTGLVPGPDTLRAENLLGLVLYGVAFAWVAVFAYEVSFRLTARHDGPDSPWLGPNHGRQ